jgi:hypothetical protein
MKDYYKILGIEAGADTETIRKAYRSLAKMYHPDLNGSAQANEFFILLNEAHTVLTDEAQRIVYDQHYLSRNSRRDHAKNFHYDWNSMYSLQNRHKQKPVAPSQVMQLGFGLEMFVGFTETLLVLGYIFRGPVHPVYGVFGIPGILLVLDGWKGIMGRKSLLGGIIKAVKRLN